MPSALPIPTIDDLVQAFHDGVQSFDEDESRIDGGKYDWLGGIGALFWSQEAQYTRDLFLDVYDGAASSDALTRRLFKRYGIPRTLDTYGVGTSTWTRPSTSAGAGTIWKGTRIQVVPPGGLSQSLIYAVDADAPCAANQLSVPVRMRATALGTGTSIDSTKSSISTRVTDPLWDNTFTVPSLQIADGTDFERAKDYLARVYATRAQNRNGYQAAIIKACQAAGAANVAAYASNFAGDGVDVDFGTNVVYVGDAGYTATKALINACLIALEGVRNLGADLQVLPMSTEVLPVIATAYLWDDPGQLDAVDLLATMTTGLEQYFTGISNGFAYQLDGMAGAMSGGSSEVQSIAFATPTVSQNVTSGSPPAFPSTLTRWTIDPSQVLITLAGPQ